MLHTLLISFTDPKLLVPVIAAVVVVLLLIVLIVVISKKKSKTPAEGTSDDRELVASNAKAVEVLIALAEGNEEVVGKLNELQEEIKYLIPSDNAKVYDADKKIKNLIGDLKIVLNKGKEKDNSAILEAIKEIKVAVAERNVNVSV